MSGHPSRCAGCEGSGHMPGPPIIETIRGRRHEYPTVVPCTHPWWHDDTGWNPYYDEPLDRDHPRAEAAFARGYAQGLAELDAMRNPPPQQHRRRDTA